MFSDFHPYLVCNDKLLMYICLFFGYIGNTTYTNFANYENLIIAQLIYHCIYIIFIQIRAFHKADKENFKKRSTTKPALFELPASTLVYCKSCCDVLLECLN